MESCPSSPRRKILQMAVTTILIETGFDAVERDALETLTEMFQSVLFEIGNTARSYCELAGRTEPLMGDIVLALVQLGIRTEGIEAYGQRKRDDRLVIPQPQQAQSQKQLNILQAGTKNPHPSHIPSWLPDLPDPHAYVRTPTYKQPVTEYEAIREKAANQKRDIEKALTKFLAKTSETQSLFESEDTQFPLIACKPAFPPYLAALNPTDQVFDFEELEYYYQVANRKEDITTKEENENGDDEDVKGMDGELPDENCGGGGGKIGKEDENSNQASNSAIDNPYLRAASMPKKQKSDPSLF